MKKRLILPVARHLPVRLIASLALVGAALVSSGCATVSETLGLGRTSDQAAATPGGRKLAAGVQRYENGDFVGAIRELNAPEIAQADVRTRVEAGKYLAFAYCVTKRRTLCRQTFDHVLKIDPTFELTSAEAGHPLWGPVYVESRKAAQRRVD